MLAIIIVAVLVIVLFLADAVGALNLRTTIRVPQPGSYPNLFSPTPTPRSIDPFHEETKRPAFGDFCNLTNNNTRCACYARGPRGPVPIGGVNSGRYCQVLITTRPGVVGTVQQCACY
jgi:hypothetical protein